MDSHKKILGILYLVWGSLSLLIIFALSLFFSVIFYNLPMHEFNSFEFGLAKTIAMVTAGFVMIVITIPSIVGGIGMLMNQRWAFIVVVVAGIFSLVSFPMGTAIGIYTLWAFFREQEIERNGGQPETFERRTN